MKTSRSKANPLTKRTPVVVTVGATPALDDIGSGADEALGGAISRAIAEGEVQGGAGETTVFHGSATGPSHVIVIGTGSGDRDALVKAGGAIAKVAGRLRTVKLVVALPADITDTDAQSLLDGVAYGAYRFDRFRSAGDGPAPTTLSEVTIVGGGPAAAKLAASDIVNAHVNAARDLSNTPGNHLTPPMLAEYAMALAKLTPGLTCKILGPKELEKLGAGALLCVAQGSPNPAQLIVMRYAPAKAATSEVLGIVGKAVTFDTGGISIKPSGGMEEMKMDMGGGAATIEGIAAIAALGLPIEVLAVVPSAENMPDGTAIKPGDVVTAMNGKTIEVVNTDAEGRLILADALTYAARNGATRIINFATLTGAIVIALGEVYAGLFGSDKEWTSTVFDAGEASGDLVWELPLHEGYRPLIKSPVADLSNAAKKRQASSIYAAMFLREFTDGLPWCHVDIAGTGMVNGAGTGFGVRLITTLAGDLTK